MGRVIASFGQAEPGDMADVPVQGEEHIPQWMSLPGVGRRPGQLLISCGGSGQGDAWCGMSLAHFLMEHLAKGTLAEMVAELERLGAVPGTAREERPVRRRGDW